jgi:AcrR family transcriptional regulator
MARVPRATRRNPRKIPRQTRSKATVDAIVEAAARILERDGYTRASVNRIAALAGVSVGSLYQYFPTKEAVVAAVAARLGQDMLVVFGRDLAELAFIPIEQGIQGIVAQAMAAFRVRPKLRRVLREEAPELHPLVDVRDFDAQLADVLVAYFEFGHAGASNRPRNTRLAVGLLMAAVEAIADTFAGDPTIDQEELVRETAALVARYLRAEP